MNYQEKSDVVFSRTLSTGVLQSRVLVHPVNLTGYQWQVLCSPEVLTSAPPRWGNLQTWAGWEFCPREADFPEHGRRLREHHMDKLIQESHYVTFRL